MVVLEVGWEKKIYVVLQKEFLSRNVPYKFKLKHQLFIE